MGELITRKDLRISDRGIGDNEGVYVHLAKVKSIYYETTTREENGGKFLVPAGTIDIGVIDQTRVGQATELLAYPFQESLIDLPVEGELVEVFSFTNKRFYRKILVDSQASREKLSQLDETINKIIPGKLQKYANPGSVSSAVKDSLGLDKQKETNETHRVSNTKGNLLLQSRYGQSLRMHSDITNGENNPVLTIRNGESEKSKTQPKNFTIKEDINLDGSTIEMSAGKYVSNFLPGVIRANGVSNFTYNPSTQESNSTSPDFAFENYPKVLDGNQIVITSDRLIFSARKNEMIFWAKGKFGVITDGIFSVDSGNGITIVNHGKNDIDIEGKDKTNIVVRVSNGKIYLGDGYGSNDITYPALIGNGVTDAIATILTILREMGGILDPTTGVVEGGIKTPSGPTCGLTSKVEASINKLADDIKRGALYSTKVYIAP